MLTECSEFQDVGNLQKFFNFTLDNCVRCEPAFVRHNSIFYHKLVDVRANIQALLLPLSSFNVHCTKIFPLLRIWSHLRKKSLMENFIFCAVVFPVICYLFCGMLLGLCSIQRSLLSSKLQNGLDLVILLGSLFLIPLDV